MKDLERFEKLTVKSFEQKNSKEMRSVTKLLKNLVCNKNIDVSIFDYLADTRIPTNYIWFLSKAESADDLDLVIDIMCVFSNICYANNSRLILSIEVLDIFYNLLKTNLEVLWSNILWAINNLMGDQENIIFIQNHRIIRKIIEVYSIYKN